MVDKTKDEAKDATPAAAPKRSTSRYKVLSKLHHISPGWKKGDKQIWQADETIELPDDHAAPLLKRKTIELTK